MSRPRGIPAYRLHRPTGLATVRFPVPFQGKRDHYLGQHATLASRSAYDRLVAEWLLVRQQPAQAAAPAKADAVTVGAILAAYWQFVTGPQTPYWKNGRLTSQVDRIKAALGRASDLFAECLATDFGPKSLRAVRADMIARRWSRNYANSCTGCIKRAFVWAASEETIPGAIAQNLWAVKNLRKGARGVKDMPKVRLVPRSQVDATLTGAPPTLRDMIEVQYLGDMRPAEVCALTPAAIDRDGLDADGNHYPDLWVYVVGGHKTEHHGDERVILLGARAQKILSPYLARRPADQAVFSPAEAEIERHELARRSRKTAVQPSQLNRQRTQPRKSPGNSYCTASYGRAIRYAAIKAGVEPWAPNRLRKLRAFEVRSQFGPEAAGAILGHAGLNVVDVYAESDRRHAERVMRQTG